LEKADFSTPGQLLSLGAAVWSTNVIAFALWYWHLDSGGPVARAHRRSTPLPAFRFLEHDLDSLMDSGCRLTRWTAGCWYPQFVTIWRFPSTPPQLSADVSAIRHWSKLCLMAESAISLVLAALVVARAVNIL
jgi:hypothetical protein